jgi:uncharacterized membrane protein YfcA
MTFAAIAAHLLLFMAGFASWTLSTLAAGGGSMLLLPAVTYLVPANVVAPLVTVASLFASPTRIVLLWTSIRWQVVRHYLPGACIGAVTGSFVLSRIGAEGPRIVIALFLISTFWQYRFGERPRSFGMRLAWFVPLSVAVGLVSGLVGASGLLANPFYLNYGLIKEEMIATRAVNSTMIQVTKLGAYSAFGLLNTDVLLGGLAAGTGAMAGIWISGRWLTRISDKHFRQLSILLMVTVGVLMLWQQRTLFFGAR